MNSFGPVEIGLIAAIIIAIICFILFLVALKSKNNMKHKANEEYNLKEQQLKSSHEEALEKNVLKIKTSNETKEEFEVNGKEREIDALKLFSKNKSEYVTDMRLIGIRDRLVKEKRIRREDMHIMANIFYQVMSLIIFNVLAILCLLELVYISLIHNY